MKNILLFFALLIALGVQSQEKDRLVNVIGEGIVTVVPDKILIRASVEHSGDSIGQVKAQNDAVASEILEYLESQGIPSENIRTEFLRLNKQYDYNTKQYKYNATQTISIKLDDLGNYEAIMSGLLQSGLNRIDFIEFLSSREEEFESEARRKAVLSARQKAEEFSEALGQEIGKALEINEIESNGFQPVSRSSVMKMEDSGARETIAPGELEIKVRVRVGFLLD